MPLTVRTITPPTAEPLSLAEAKVHCKVDHVAEDAAIAGFLAAARAHVEKDLRRQLMPATLRLTLDAFPAGCGGGGAVIELPRPPLIEITSITYVDVAGETQTMDADDYKLDSQAEPARLAPRYGTSWPATRDEIGAVAITYRAGYPSAALVPAAAKQAIRFLLGHFYINRDQLGEADLPAGTRRVVRGLLDDDRIEGVW